MGEVYSRYFETAMDDKKTIGKKNKSLLPAYQITLISFVELTAADIFRF